MKPALRLEIIESPAKLDGLHRQLELLAKSCGAGVFDRPGFFLPWMRAAVASGQQPACLCLFRGTDLKGFLPLFFRRDRKALLARRGGFPVFGSSPAFDLLLSPSEEETEACVLLAQALERKRWLDLTFANLPDHNRLGHCLGRVFRRQGCQISRPPGLSYMMVEGFKDNAEYLAHLKGRHRRNWKRKERHVRESCRIDLFTHQDDYEACLPMMRDVLKHSWKFDSRMQHIGMRLYEEQVLGTARDGTLGVWFASRGGRPLAFTIELADETGHHHGYFTAYRPEHLRLGAGAALVFMAVQNALERGNCVYDLWATRGHLNQLATGTRETVSLSICRKGAVPRLRLAMAERLKGIRQVLRTAKPRPRT